MKCPKCGHEQPGTEVCESCGIYFEKYRQSQERPQYQGPASARRSKKKGGGMAWVLVSGIVVVGTLYLTLAGTSDDDVQKSSSQSEIANTSPMAVETIKNSLLKQLNQSHPPGNAIEKARNATVFIETSWGAEGSGFIVSDDCDVITNKHVIELDAERLRRAVYSNPNLYNEMQNAAVAMMQQINDLKREQIKLRVQGGDPKEIDAIGDEIQELQEQLRTFGQDAKVAIDEEIDDQVWKSQDDSITVSLIDGTEFKVDKVTKSENKDLATFRLPAQGCPFIEVASSKSIHQGDQLFTIGSPAGLTYTVTSGIFSGFQTLEEQSVLQTDAPINPGNSGGPLIQKNGQVVGVNTAVMVGAQGIGFAIPIEDVKELMPSWNGRN